MQTVSTYYGRLWLLLFLQLWVAIPSYAQNNSSPQLMITEYVEGKGRNKWLEITNIGKVSFLPSQRRYVCVFSNEKARSPANQKPSFSVLIGQQIDPQASYLFRHSRALLPALLLDRSQPTIVCSFNGDDLIIISKSKDATAWEMRTDVVGEGSEWGKDVIARRHPGSKPKPTYSRNDWNFTSELDELLENERPCSERLGCYQAEVLLSVEKNANMSYAKQEIRFYDFQGRLQCAAKLRVNEINAQLARLAHAGKGACFIVHHREATKRLVERICYQKD